MELPALADGSLRSIRCGAGHVSAGHRRRAQTAQSRCGAGTPACRDRTPAVAPCRARGRVTMSLHFGAEGSLGILMYVAAVVAVFASIFWKPVAGILYLVPLIPLQTMRYRLNDFPLG